MASSLNATANRRFVSSSMVSLWCPAESCGPGHGGNDHSWRYGAAASNQRLTNAPSTARVSDDAARRRLGMLAATAAVTGALLFLWKLTLRRDASGRRTCSPLGPRSGRWGRCRDCGQPVDGPCRPSNARPRFARPAAPGVTLCGVPWSTDCGLSASVPLLVLEREPAVRAFPFVFSIWLCSLNCITVRIGDGDTRG
jgi:hypothetical protein